VAKLTQAALVAAAQSGDRQAFDVLAASCVDRLYAIARLVLRDSDRAEDAVQETLVRCWRDLPALRDADRFDAWIRRLLMRAITDEFRRDRRHQASVTLLRFEPSTSDASAALVVREQLDVGFRRLSHEHRAIVVLSLYLGLSIVEAAATLGIPVGTAKSRLHYATDAMRLALEADARPVAREVSA
jgi:RNA polymerase sigma-70 factor (ECF subfamily)